MIQAKTAQDEKKDNSGSEIITYETKLLRKLYPAHGCKVKKDDANSPDAAQGMELRQETGLVEIGQCARHIIFSQILPPGQNFRALPQELSQP